MQIAAIKYFETLTNGLGRHLSYVQSIFPLKNDLILSMFANGTLTFLAVGKDTFSRERFDDTLGKDNVE